MILAAAAAALLAAAQPALADVSEEIPQTGWTFKAPNKTLALILKDGRSNTGIPGSDHDLTVAIPDIKSKITYCHFRANLMGTTTLGDYKALAGFGEEPTVVNRQRSNVKGYPAVTTILTGKSMGGSGNSPPMPMEAHIFEVTQEETNGIVLIFTTEVSYNEPNTALSTCKVSGFFATFDRIAKSLAPGPEAAPFKGGKGGAGSKGAEDKSKKSKKGEPSADIVEKRMAEARNASSGPEPGSPEARKLAAKEKKERAARDKKRRSREALERSPKLLNTGADLLVKGDLDGAREKIHAALETNPASPDAHFAFGVLSLLTGDRAKFDRHLGKAQTLEKNPSRRLRALLAGDEPVKKGVKDPYLAIADGLIAESQGDAEAAMVQYNTAVHLKPDLWLGWAFRGILRTSLKDCSRAADDLDQAARLNFTYKPQARFYQSRCL